MPSDPPPPPKFSPHTAAPPELVAAMLLAVTTPLTVTLPLDKMLPALNPPATSRFTIAFTVLNSVGATAQLSPSVPLPVTGDPVTVKSGGADKATLFTLPGKVCPVANVKIPLLLIFRPVSAGADAPSAYRRFKVPDGAAVLFPAGSASHWKVWFTGVLRLLLNDDATILSA
jgi:hypothetical protein